MTVLIIFSMDTVTNVSSCTCHITALFNLTTCHGVQTSETWKKVISHMTIPEIPIIISINKINKNRDIHWSLISCDGFITCRCFWQWCVVITMAKHWQLYHQVCVIYLWMLKLKRNQLSEMQFDCLCFWIVDNN